MKCTMKKDTDWRDAYRQVLFEADPEKLQMSIEAAHEAVERRVCTLNDVRPQDMSELTQLAYASHILTLLNSTITERKEKAGDLDWLAFKT